MPAGRLAVQCSARCHHWRVHAVVETCGVCLRQELAEDGVNVFAMRSDVSLDDAGWGSPTFHKMVRLKLLFRQ